MKLKPTNTIGTRTLKLRPRRPAYVLHRFIAPVYFAFLGLAAATTHSFGASINYGNFGPTSPGIQFLGITESSGTDAVPLYGPPTPFATGLDFDPVGFTTSSAGGAVDITDGQLNLTVDATEPGVGITYIALSEAGDYTLAGVGTSATAAFFGSIMRVTVTELDGVDVAPISLVPVNASFGDSLPGAVVVAPWSLGLLLDIAAQVGPGPLVTEVEVVIDNALVSISEFQSVSFGSKKDFRLEVGTVGPVGTLRALSVPETGSTVWLMSAGVSLVLLGHRWAVKRRFVQTRYWK
jgi:hypothetical protein